MILFYVGIDQRRNLLSFRDYAKPRYVRTKDGLVLTNVPVPTPEQIMAREKLRPYSIDFFQILVYKLKERSGRLQREAHEITKAILYEMHDVCEKEDIEFVVTTGHYSMLLNELSNEGITVLPFHRYDVAQEVFKNHWTPQGHKIVAQRVLNELIEHGLVSPLEARLLYADVSRSSCRN